MNVFSGVILYLAIAGAVLGLSLNDVYKTCGEPLEVDLEDVVSATLWPTIVTAIILTDDGVMRSRESRCEREGL